jgi:predicted transcriptional regulator of viral defense system
MAEREKALADCLDRPDLCGGVVEAAKAVWRGRKEMDWGKVHACGRQMGNSSILKRLGFLLELFELGAPDLLAQIQADLGAGYTMLDPLYPAEGRHDSRWRLVVNVPERELLDWREY